MLRIRVANTKQTQEVEHATGPLEFGRGPQRGIKRIIIDDDYVSRDQMRVEELPDGWLRVENLSLRTRIDTLSGVTIDIGQQRDLDLPVCLTVGYTRIEVEPVTDDALENASLQTISEPLRKREKERLARPLSDLGDAPAPETIAHWLEVVIALQGLAAGSHEFFEQTAQSLVELVGLDLGLVLLRRDDHWEVAARYATSNSITTHFSRTLLKQVVAQRRTFYQDVQTLPTPSESLRAVDAVVVSPIFGLQDDVVGVLYGVRGFHGREKGRIRPLEAQVVQLMAASAGANLARLAATRTRIQLEEFCPPEVVRELERNPSLMEPHTQEITVLMSDLRGFTSLSERLGAKVACELVRDMMERLTSRVLEKGGTIIDYAGDGLLAMWNAPIPHEDHVVRGCRAALAMRGELPELNRRWQPVVGEPLVLGIGVNTGLAQVGNTGTSRSKRFGAIGHTVNLASRVQDATKRFSVPILITGSTRDRLPASFLTRRVARTPLAGVADEVPLYELVSETGSVA
jgi:adenylate cyclase